MGIRVSVRVRMGMRVGTGMSVRMRMGMRVRMGVRVRMRTGMMAFGVCAGGSSQHREHDCPVVH